MNVKKIKFQCFVNLNDALINSLITPLHVSTSGSFDGANISLIKRHKQITPPCKVTKEERSIPTNLVLKKVGTPILHRKTKCYNYQNISSI